jgi:hypothetical protein
VTTGTDIVHAALQKIGAHSRVQPASPEAMDVGLYRLNSMIAEWQDDNIELGAVPLETIGEDLSEPLGCRNAIENALALVLAPEFPGSQVSTELERQAKLTYNKLVRRWKVRDVRKTKTRGTLPIGQGNSYWNSRYTRTFLEETEDLG